MGLLDLILGQSNPVSQWADAHPGTLGAIGGGLGSGATFSQGLANAAQMLPQGKASDVQLGLTIQGRNATADWLAASSNPNLQALAEPVRNGTIAGSDAMKAAFAPGQLMPPGSTYLPNPQSPNFVPPSVPPPSPAQTTSLPASTVAPPPPSGPPAALATLQQGLANVSAPQAQQPIPLAPIQSASQSQAPAAYDPSKPFTAGATNPMDMTPAQRQVLGKQYGLTGSPLASFVVSGRVPQNVSQTDSFRPATPADLQKWGISPGAGQAYEVNTITNELKPVSGSVATGDQSATGLPPGTTGSATIDPTAPGYASKPVVAGLTQAALDQKALSYLTGGTNPPIGRTGTAGAQSAAISNRMAEMDPTGNLAANKAQLRALTGSLEVNQKYADSTQRAIQNAEAGFQQVVSAFKGKVNASQYPTVNAALNAAAAQMAPGDISAYKAGLAEVGNEYTQVFARGGKVSDAVRAKSADIINGNLSIDDLGKVQDELQQQGDIVVNGARQTVQQINNQITSLAQGGSSQGSQSQTASAPTGKLADGTPIVVQNGQWVNAQTLQPVQ